MAIYAFLTGELPPRHLPDVDEETDVGRAQAVLSEVFGTDGRRIVLSYDGVDLADPEATLKSYGVPNEALINARPES